MWRRCISLFKLIFTSSFTAIYLIYIQKLPIFHGKRVISSKYKPISWWQRNKCFVGTDVGIKNNWVGQQTSETYSDSTKYNCKEFLDVNKKLMDQSEDRIIWSQCAFPSRCCFLQQVTSIYNSRQQKFLSPSDLVGN